MMFFAVQKWMIIRLASLLPEPLCEAENTDRVGGEEENIEFRQLCSTVKDQYQKYVLRI